MMRPARTVLTVSAALAAALGLAACGDSAAPPVPTPSVSLESAPAPTTAQTDDDDATAASPSGEPSSEVAPAIDDEAIAAADAAEAAVPNSRAFDLELDDDGGYDVDVFDGSVVSEVRVNGGNAVVEETDDLDGDDRAELDAATVTMQEAIATALAAHPGTVTEVELDDDRNTVPVRWEIEISVNGTTTEVYVDAATGELG